MTERGLECQARRRLITVPWAVRLAAVNLWLTDGQAVCPPGGCWKDAVGLPPGEVLIHKRKHLIAPLLPAGEAPHQVTIAAVRRRVVRRRAMEAVAGTAVLAAVISTAVPALAGVLGDTSTRAAQALAERTPTAYVVNGISNTVTPVNTATNTPGRPIKVARFPQSIAITPDGKTAYVASWATAGPGSVTPITTAANTAGKPIRVGVRPFAIAITPAGTTAYIANIGSDTVTPVNTATNRPGKPVPVGVSPLRSRSPRTGRPPTSSTRAASTARAR